MSWICKNCETENPDRLKICEVCDTPRKSSPIDELKSMLKKKYTDAAYKPFIRDHYNLLASADRGNSDDQYKVGEWFFNKDSANCYKIAAMWFLAAAKQENVAAQAKLALCYEKGYGVPKTKEVTKWYKKAADKGDVAAKRRYLKLKYDSKNYKQVIKYRAEMLFAADCGNKQSQYQLGKWFSNHQGQSSYKKEAFLWYEIAAENGYGYAMLRLGECYENGTGVSRDINAAKYWYEKAASIGYKEATQCVSRINSKIHSQKQDEITSLIDITLGILGILALGAIVGAAGYYILTDGLSNWGIQLPEIWPNTYPTNLIICIIVGIVVVVFIYKDKVI